MASLGGNSSSTTNSAENLCLEDSRKRKRMESNRESARRSRMKKQKLADDLTAQLSDLKRENGQILAAVSVTAEQFLNVEAENSVLRAQMAELTHRLHSLNEILDCVNPSPLPPPAAGAGVLAPAVGGEMMMMMSGGDGDGFVGTHLNNLGWMMMMMNQQLPLMPSSVDYCHDFGY